MNQEHLSEKIRCDIQGRRRSTKGQGHEDDCCKIDTSDDLGLLVGTVKQNFENGFLVTTRTWTILPIMFRIYQI